MHGASQHLLPGFWGSTPQPEQVPIPRGHNLVPRVTQTWFTTIPMLTCEMVELVRMGLMCSVARSAQADMQRVESRRMTRARQRDQWTTALWWWPGTGGRAETWWDTPGQ